MACSAFIEHGQTTSSLSGVGRVEKGVFMCPQGREVDTQWAFYLSGQNSSTQGCCFTPGRRLSLLAAGSGLLEETALITVGLEASI